MPRTCGSRSRFRSPNNSSSAWVDDSNTAFGTGTTLFSGVGPGTGAFSFNNGAYFGSLTAPFSMTLEVVIDHTLQNTQSTGSADLVVVPEPMATGLLGLGLVAMGFIRRRTGSD